MTGTLDDFETAWKSGEAPRIEDWLSAAGSIEAKAELLKELLAIELWWRVKAGEQPVPADYASRFPDFIEAIKLAFEEFQQSSVDSGAADQVAQTGQSGAPIADGGSSATDPTIVPLADAALKARLGDGATLTPKQPIKSNGSQAGEKIKYFGEYELLDEIARGGMGVVYRAKQRGLNRVVALKMILAGQLAGPEDVARFKTEAEAAAQLDHWGIVPIYEIGEHEGQHYFSMAFVEGQSLQDKLRNGPLEPREAAELCAKIAEAIAYAHEKGVIHRDLKPANILLDRDGTPKVTDFGLAKQIQSDSGLTQTGSIMGTPSYMPPEQASGETIRVGPLADVYSLGALLYCVLTGRPPFQAANPLDTLKQVLEQEPIPPRDLNPLTPPEVENITLKCLEKNAERRYSSSEELKDDLNRFLNDEPILAQPPTFGYRWRKAFKKHRTAFVMTAAIVGLLIAGLAGTGAMWLRASVAEKDARLAESDARSSEVTAKLRLSRSNFFLAASRFETGRVLEAHRLLDSIPAEHRDIEWYLARAQMKGGDFTCYGHLNGVNSVKFSPDGNVLASAGTSIRLWDARSGEELRVINPNAGVIYDLAFSPNGKQLAVAHKTYIGVWDLETDDPAVKLIGHSEAIYSIDFNADGTRLVSGSNDNLVVVWDVAIGRASKILRGHGNGRGAVRFGSVDSVRFLSDGRVMSGSWDGTIRIWDPKTGKEVSRIRGSDQIQGIDVNPIESQLIAASASGLTQVFDMDGTKGWTASSYAKPIFSPDGLVVAALETGNSIAILDASNGQERTRLRGHWKGVTSVCFSPDSRRLASSSADGTIRVWSLDALSGRKLQGGSPFVLGSGNEIITKGKIVDSFLGETIVEMEGQGSSVARLAVSPDGQTIFSGGGFRDNAIRSVNRTSGETKVIGRHEKQVSALDVSPSGRLLISGSDNTLKLWRINGDRTTAEWTMEALEGTVYCADFSPEGTLIASGGSDKSITVRQTSTGKVLKVLRHSNTVSAVIFSPDGEYLISACSDSAIRIWQISSGDLVRTLRGHIGGVADVAVSADGRRIVSGGRDRTLKLWDTDTGEELSSYTDDDSRVKAVAFAPSGELIASAGGGIRLWPAPRQAEVSSLWRHTAPIKKAAFGKNGNRLYTESADEQLVWDLESGSVIEGAPWDMPDGAPITSPDGRNTVVSIGEAVMIVDTEFKNSSEEVAHRNAKASPKTWWHAELANDSFKQEQWFGSVFHATYAFPAQPDSRKLYETLLTSNSHLTEEQRRFLPSAFESVIAMPPPPVPKYSKFTAETKNRNLWNKVRDPKGKPTDLELQWMAAVVRDFPKGIYFNTLGVSEYRAANYQAAIDACLRSIELTPVKTPPDNSVESLFYLPAAQPIDLATIAMSYFRLGKVEKANDYRQQLAKAMELSTFAKDEVSKGFVKEVDALFEDQKPQKTSANKM